MYVDWDNFNKRVKKRKMKLNKDIKNLDEWFKYCEKNDIVCAITGKDDLVDSAECIHICDECMRKLKDKEHVVAYPIFSFDGKCAICGKSFLYEYIKGRNVWFVVWMPVSIKAMWRVLGKKKKPLKIDGERI